MKGAVVAIAPGGKIVDTLIEHVLQLVEQVSPDRGARKRRCIISSFTLPQFYNPFPSRLSPELMTAADESLRWAQDMELVASPSAQERFESALYGEFAARTYPDAPTDRLVVAAKWCAWLFLFDDHFDDCYLGRSKSDAEAVLPNLLRCLASPEIEPLIPGNPLEAALLDLWPQTATRMSPSWRGRFKRHMHDYLMSYFWEISNRSRRHTPDLVMYIDMRRDTGATWIGFDLIPYTEGLEVPTWLNDSLLLRTMELAAIDVICISNDILSHEKEMARGEVNNIVHVAQQLTGGEIQQSVNLVNAIQNSRIRLFLDHKEQIPAWLEESEASPATRQAVERYIVGLESWIRGNLDWSLRTARYLNVEYAPGHGDRVSWAENLSGVTDDALRAPVEDRKPAGLGWGAATT
ncbi:hypothetical protein [Streptomyces sp. NPDC021096]|uniref:terpene synthase family protein n=1 Tax=Streptomyces sp. NPDC021096 TaxID=3154792 RepID=UPI0033F12458